MDIRKLPKFILDIATEAVRKKMENSPKLKTGVQITLQIDVHPHSDGNLTIRMLNNSNIPA